MPLRKKGDVPADESPDQGSPVAGDMPITPMLAIVALLSIVIWGAVIWWLVR